MTAADSERERRWVSPGWGHSGWKCTWCGVIVDSMNGPQTRGAKREHESQCEGRMSGVSKRLRQEAKVSERLADIADALTEGGLEVIGFSPLSKWVVPALCEGCGCELEYGHCYCCLPSWGYGESFYDIRHPNGIENAGRLGRPLLPLDEYLRSEEAAGLFPSPLNANEEQT